MNSLSLRSSASIFYFPNSGLSEDAQTIENQLTEVRIKTKWENCSIGTSFNAVYEQLKGIAVESEKANWDGYGAEPAKMDSYIEAQLFLNNLPVSFPLPEASIDPDGEFSFEWYRKAGYSFSVSFSGNNELTYAGIFGINNTHGTEYFDDEIPEIILENIKRIYR